ncbi:Protein TusC [Buchnera aphidicola (Eriosoma lanigerum)]|uniref:sulfurtransferase complex subunit TusC n=1 Tax=Buchnera aphidicola TaxID=9 RepID=UPI003464C534
MKKSIAFIFSHAPYGTSIGLEGVDAVLSASLVLKKIGLFFIGDGVFQLIPNQQPKQILLRNYVSALLLLPTYGVKTIYCCNKSLEDRGLSSTSILLLKVKYLDIINFYKYINSYDFILNF